MMLTTLRALLAIAGLAAMPVSLNAQRAQVPVGARVRVAWMESTQANGAIGNVVRATADTLVISTRRAPKLVTLDRGTITNLETQIGATQGRRAALYGVLGATIWAGLTYVGDRNLPARKRVQQSLGWGAVGGIVGALFGMKFSQTRWQSVSP